MEEGTAPCSAQAEVNLAMRAREKARLYESRSRDVQQQVEAIAGYAAGLDAGPAARARRRAGLGRARAQPRAADKPTPAR